MTRIAIYARYSSDLQSDRSIDDQVRLCRELAARHGGTVVEVFSDYAISGGHVRNRPGFLSLMEAARAGEFDILIAEALDRMSRDQEDIAGAYKRFTHSGVRIITASEGEVNELHIGLKGTMNALFIKDLAAKVKRGHRGRLEAGASAGGLSYGYKMVRNFDDKGGFEAGLRAIHPEQADVVRRIFKEYISGMSARTIAIGLNRDKIPSPRGGQWNASSISGNRARRNGILNNEIYLGKLIYNRQSFSKDPETGRRLPRVNAEKDWIVKQVPELQIIDDGTWARAHDVKRAYSETTKAHQHRPKHPLSGILACGVCGGPLVSKGAGRVECSYFRTRGTCSNGQSVMMSIIQEMLLDGLNTRLTTPEALKRFTATFHQEMHKAKKARQINAGGHEKRLKQVDKQIGSIVNAVTDGMYHASLKGKLDELEGERRILTQEIAAAKAEAAAVIEIHPNLAPLYTARIERLTGLVAEKNPSPEAINILRSLIHKVVVMPAAANADGVMTVEIQGKLDDILEFMGGREKKEHSPVKVGKVMVARGRFTQKPQIPEGPIYSIKIERKK